VSKLDEVLIARALDVGVYISQIETVEQAACAVRCAKYSPKGTRGVCRFVRAADYGAKDRFKYFEDANNNLVILQLEGCEAIENINEILSVEGIDILFIGPYDLSQSLGVPGQTGPPLG